MILSTAFVQWRGWAWTDPLAALFISAMILASTAPLLRQGAEEALLQRVPRGDAGAAIANAVADIYSIAGVVRVDREHYWAHTPDEIWATMRLVVRAADVSAGLGEVDQQAVLRAARLALAEAGITQCCLQVEREQALLLEDHSCVN